MMLIYFYHFHFQIGYVLRTLRAGGRVSLKNHMKAIENVKIFLRVWLHDGRICAMKAMI
jgi:hypothetical protein